MGYAATGKRILPYPPELPEHGRCPGSRCRCVPSRGSRRGPAGPALPGAAGGSVSLQAEPGPCTGSRRALGLQERAERLRNGFGAAPRGPGQLHPPLSALRYHGCMRNRPERTQGYQAEGHARHAVSARRGPRRPPPGSGPGPASGNRARPAARGDGKGGGRAPAARPPVPGPARQPSPGPAWPSRTGGRCRSVRSPLQPPPRRRRRPAPPWPPPSRAPAPPHAGPAASHWPSRPPVSARWAEPTPPLAVAPAGFEWGEPGAPRLARAARAWGHVRRDPGREPEVTLTP